MKTLESAPSEIDPKMRQILDSPPSSNYMIRQIQIAVEKCIRDNPEHPLDQKAVEKAGEDWADSDESRKFRYIALHPEFKTHPRFNGDMAKIALNDVEKVTLGDEKSLSELFGE